MLRRDSMLTSEPVASGASGPASPVGLFRLPVCGLPAHPPND